MIALSSFHSRIAPWVPAVPIPTIDAAIVDVCIDFCERSLGLRAQLDTVYTLANAATVDLDVPEQTRLVRLMLVKINDVDAHSMADDNFGGHNLSATAGTSVPREYSVQNDRTLALYPTPNAAYSVKAFAAIKPTRSATTVDDRLLEDWGDVIASGVLGRLFAMPHEWANAGLSQVHSVAFLAGVNKAMLEAKADGTRAESRVRPVWI